MQLMIFFFSKIQQNTVALPSEPRISAYTHLQPRRIKM